MLAPVLNALALQNALQRIGIDPCSIRYPKCASAGVHPSEAIRHLERPVVILPPHRNPFSTDTATVLRAMEISAQVIMKGRKLTASIMPIRLNRRRKYEKISFLSILNQKLKVMDSTAISLCMDNKLPLIVFNLKIKGNFKRVALGEPIGTLVTLGDR